MLCVKIQGELAVGICVTFLHREVRGRPQGSPPHIHPTPALTMNAPIPRLSHVKGGMGCMRDGRDWKDAINRVPTNHYWYQA